MELGIFAFLGAILIWMTMTTPRFRSVAFGYLALFCVIAFVVSLLTGQNGGAVHFPTPP